MKYNLSNEFEKKKASKYFNKLLENKCKVEIKKILPKRTNKQNRYLHKMFQLFGVELGYTLEEAKASVKRRLKFYYEKNGEKFLRSTADTDTKEMTKFIDDFRALAFDLDCYLPDPEEYFKNECEIDNYIETNL